MAAVELLVSDRYWLTREDFRRGYVWAGRSGVGDRWLAIVDWSAVVEALDSGRLTCSPSKAQVLRVAASIAKGTAVNLHTCLSILDESTVILVAGALLRAAGRHVPAGGAERR